MVMWVVSCAIETRGGAMSPGKLKIAVRFSAISSMLSLIRGTSKVNCWTLELKVRVKGPIAA